MSYPDRKYQGRGVGDSIMDSVIRKIKKSGPRNKESEDKRQNSIFDLLNSEEQEDEEEETLLPVEAEVEKDNTSFKAKKGPRYYRRK